MRILALLLIWAHTIALVTDAELCLEEVGRCLQLAVGMSKSTCITFGAEVLGVEPAQLGLVKHDA
jgi:hypothetical protein